MLPTGISSGYAPSPLLTRRNQQQQRPSLPAEVLFGAKAQKVSKDDKAVKEHLANRQQPAVKFGAKKELRDEKDEIVHKAHETLKKAEAEKEKIRGEIAEYNEKLADISTTIKEKLRLEERKKAAYLTKVHDPDSSYLNDEQIKAQKGRFFNRDPRPEKQIVHQKELDKLLDTLKTEVTSLEEKEQDYRKQLNEAQVRLVKAERKFATAKVEADKAEQTNWGKTLEEIEADKKKQEEKENKKDGIIINNYAGGAPSTDSAKKAEDGKKTEETKASDAAKTGDAKTDKKTDEKLVIRSEFINDKVLDETSRIAKDLDKHFGRKAWFFEKVWAPNLNKDRVDLDPRVKKLTKETQEKIEKALLDHPDSQTYAEIKHVKNFNDGKDAYGNKAEAEKYANNIIFNAAQKIAKEALKYPEDAEKHKTQEKTRQKIKSDLEIKAEKEREKWESWLQFKLGAGMAGVGAVMFRFGALPLVGGSSLIGIPAALIGGTMATQGAWKMLKNRFTDVKTPSDLTRKAATYVHKELLGGVPGMLVEGTTGAFHVTRGAAKGVWNSPTTVKNVAQSVDGTLGGAPSWVGGQVVKGATYGTKQAAATVSRHFPTVRDGVSSRLGLKKAEALPAASVESAAVKNVEPESPFKNADAKPTTVSEATAPEKGSPEPVAPSPPEVSTGKPTGETVMGIPVGGALMGIPLAGGQTLSTMKTMAEPKAPQQHTVTERFVTPALNVTAGSGLIAGGLALHLPVVTAPIGIAMTAGGFLLAGHGVKQLWERNVSA